MNDPVGVMIRLITNLFIFIGGLIGEMISMGLSALLGSWNSGGRENAKTRKVMRVQADEDARQTECRKAVLDFAHGFGYLTREVMSQKEVGELIDSGISGQALIDTFYKRMGQIPGIFLGQREMTGGGTLDIKLPFSLRSRHCYLIGRSGSGKTNLIRTMIMQDIYFGRGVGVLAPESELLTDELLPYIPEDRIDDIVYVNPDDKQSPIAFNPLSVDEDEDIEQKVDDFVTIFKRAVGDTGYRMDQILSETLYALIRRPGSTLDDIEKFLSRSNPAFRNEVLKTADEKTRTFFEDTYPTMDKNAANPVLSRISAFTRREAVRNILCQRGKSFSFSRAMNEGKILFFNVADGILGEQASQLLGQIIVSKMQLAAMSRAKIPKNKRRPFYLYLDEFQTFTGVAQTSYEKILSRARKYHLGLVLAHQQTGQISQNLLKEIFGNVSTFIAFNVSHDDAAKLSREYAYQYGEQMHYVDPGDFIGLRTGEAIAKIGRTVLPLTTLLAPQEADYQRAEYIIERSRKNYSQGGVWRTKEPEPLKQLPEHIIDNDDDSDIDPRRVF